MSGARFSSCSRGGYSAFKMSRSMSFSASVALTLFTVFFLALAIPLLFSLALTPSLSFLLFPFSSTDSIFLVFSGPDSFSRVLTLSLYVPPFQKC